jgi:hypothetical protein
MSPGGPYELKIEGNGNVRRFFSAVARDEPADTPAIRRIAPRNVSLIFIKLFSRKVNVETAAPQLPAPWLSKVRLALETKRKTPP